MYRPKFSISFVVFVVLFTKNASPGLTGFSGEGQWDWTDGTSVILADVMSVAKTDTVGYQHKITLIPTATLTGQFDCGLDPILEDADLFVGPGGSSILRPPKSGDKVLVVIRRRYDDGKWAVSGAACKFMPNGSALIRLDGLGDPKVAQTLKNLQAARAKAVAAAAKATTGPATRPQ